MKIHAYIQARMCSERLPGKMMLKLGDKTILEHVIAQTRKLDVDKICLLTSDETQDIPLLKIAKKEGIETVCVYEPLERYIEACHIWEPDYFLRVCGDSPFLDPILGADMIREIKEDNNISGSTFCSYEYYAWKSNGENIPNATGFCFEAIQGKAFLEYLKKINEHVTPGLYKKQLICRFFEEPYFLKGKVSLDTKDDYEYLKKLYTYFGRIPYAIEVNKYNRDNKLN